jgi:hypothetical protein
MRAKELNHVKVTRDMAIFDDCLPLGMRLRGYALGSALMIAAHVAWVISHSFFPCPITPQVLGKTIKHKE